MRRISVKCDRCGAKGEYDSEDGITATGWKTVSSQVGYSGKAHQVELCKKCFKEYSDLFRSFQRVLITWLQDHDSAQEAGHEIKDSKPLRFVDNEIKHQRYNPDAFTTEGNCPHCGSRIEKPFTKPTGVCPKCHKPAFWDTKDFIENTIPEEGEKT